MHESNCKPFLHIAFAFFTLAGAEVVALDVYLEPPNGMVAGVALIKVTCAVHVLHVPLYSSLEYC